MQEGDDGEGTELGARGLAVEEEVEEFVAYGVTLRVEAGEVLALACIGERVKGAKGNTRLGVGMRRGRRVPFF